MPAELIVCERRDRLTPVLRHALVRQGIPAEQLMGKKTWLRQRQGVAACRRLLDDAPASIVVLEVTRATLTESFALLAGMNSCWPQARAVAYTADEVRAAGPALREAGAIHVIDDFLELNGVACLALTHFRRQPQRQPRWCDEIWQHLPWTTSDCRAW